MITVRTAYPKKIAPLVKSFWYLEVTPTSAGYYQEEIVPDGHHEIIFYITAEPGRVKMAGAAGWVEEPHAFVVGQTLQKHHLQLSPGSRLYGIRFYPHTLPAFLDIPVAELTDRFFALDTVMDARPFWDCIRDDPGQTFLNFELLLSSLLRRDAISSHGYQYIDAAVASILNKKGNVTGAQLLRRTGISKTHLDGLFLKYVGITPKIFSRIIQLNFFITYRTNHPESSLTQCSYEAGYYDQSHLSKAFDAFIGRSPRAFFAGENEINGVFTAL